MDDPFEWDCQRPLQPSYKQANNLKPDTSSSNISVVLQIYISICQFDSSTWIFNWFLKTDIIRLRLPLTSSLTCTSLPVSVNVTITHLDAHCHIQIYQQVLSMLAQKKFHFCLFVLLFTVTILNQVQCLLPTSLQLLASALV